MRRGSRGGAKIAKTLEAGSYCCPIKHVPIEINYAAAEGAIGSNDG